MQSAFVSLLSLLPLFLSVFRVLLFRFVFPCWIFFISLFANSAAHANLLGMLPGQSARVESHPTASIEVGANWYTRQMQWVTARVNVKPSPGLQLFADYAQLKISELPVNATVKADFPGYGLGGGLLFSVPDFLPSYDVAVRGAYHASVTNISPVSKEQLQADMSLHQQQLNADLLFTPIDPVLENGLSWYGNVGYVWTGAHARIRTVGSLAVNTILNREKHDWSLGVGFVMPLRYGSIFGGIEWLSSDVLLGGGLRFAF